MQTPTNRSKLAPKTFVATFVGVLAIGSAFSSVSHAATTAKSAKSAKPSANAGAAFCRQVTASQAVIAKATGTPKAKLTAIGAEWTKIAATAPADIKTDVLAVRTAYTAAAKAGVDTAAKTPAVASSGQKISSYFAQNCGGGGLGGSGGRDGGPGEGGGNSPERAAYRDCLTKNGVTLPAAGQRGGNGGGNGADNAGAPTAARPAGAGAGAVGNGGGRRGGGAGFGLDSADPEVAKALKACESLLPAGGFGGFGGGGGGRGGLRNPAIQACLTKKGVKIPTPAAGAPGGGNRAPLDAKTQAAVDACQKELGTNG